MQKAKIFIFIFLALINNEIKSNAQQSAIRSSWGVEPIIINTNVDTYTNCDSSNVRIHQYNLIHLLKFRCVTLTEFYQPAKGLK
jgi:hypothetical protein